MLTLLLCAAGAVAFYRAPIDTLNDYRPLMEKLRRWVQPGDVVLGTYIWMPAMLDSYAPELRGRYAWREDFASIDNANRLMPIATQGAARVWSLNYIRNPDAPDVGAVTWLRRELAYADREASGTLSALLFARVPNAADSQTARITIFDKRIRMEVVRASGTLAQGHSIEAAMRFTALETLEGAVAISLQLVDADGVLIAQNDGDAVNGLAPSFSWRPNEPVLDRRALLVREPLPRGQYALRLAIYDRSTGNRWPTEMGAGFVQLGAFAAD